MLKTALNTIQSVNQSIYYFVVFQGVRTAAVAKWLERPPREREVVGTIPGRHIPKSLTLVVVAFPLGAQDYGNSTTTGPPVSELWTG